MQIEERHILFRQLMWDYSIPVTDIEDVLQGRKELAGHYTRQAIFVKLLESYSWFTILQLFSPAELRLLLTDEVIGKLRFKSLQNKYEFVQKRLQELVPIAG